MGCADSGWDFPCEPTNFISRKFSKSQEILRNISKILEILDIYCVLSTFKAL